ncbi:glutamate--cysteine ligase [Corynebacterium sp. ES2794-CONJ1]|uniref:glutamate--cysteine ligase n=1 Tax=unclassified Corynebacterium TaxID=2624378 RepID=UPI00216A19C4|nr:MULTISPECIES: glutamate--cysteine ligase [unclassified Corynebacterium]MCS4490226.1 glutamate--cysteine ligase [Corynebacterium sp. ES2775-CONJ]MCS4491963.1 glutamate--cysteine ligase [Corynebacterium sp. ES2715-CONJ3]MCS4532067.1 glutamate--cysteine ligase [Corynebacterium sp. ES2730-CONJ]MCU9519469.1 glutamate--cysteine ligase [Corynebacterium sp. ES2794-CONJ1]
MQQRFNASAHPTLGVEWELALMDPQTYQLVPIAEEIAEQARERCTDVRFELEYLQNTVEIVTPVCQTVGEAVNYLDVGLRAVREAATERGLELWAAGSHPIAHYLDQEVSTKGRYGEMVEYTQFWGKQMLIWGLHVHVGISDKERVWPIINALMTKYSHLLALTASSPGWEGCDTGYASNRTMLYQQLPTAGLPYQFANWSEWELFMNDQERAGVTELTGTMHLDIRPSGKWGTIEIRACDAPTNFPELAATVALAHCLVVHFDRMIERGETLPSLKSWQVADNKWRAARFGLEAELIVDEDASVRPVTEELEALVTELLPLARELQCDQELLGIRTIIATGASYQRQRKLYQRTGSWDAAMDMVVAELHQPHQSPKPV